MDSYAALQALALTSDDNSFESKGRNIEKLFDEARQNMRKQHKHWETYNQKRREVNIKVNDLVLVQTHFISAADRRVVGKFMPKFEGPYRVLEGSQSIAGPSHQQDSRQGKPPTERSRHEGSRQYNKARETKTTKNGTNRAADRRTVRSKQTKAVRPCPYYLHSRVRQPEGFPEERRTIGMENIAQNNIRRRIISMEALDGDPVDRSE
ncbi:uncharacterized protein TNCV_695961 [Trichonephila clavipes]|nr:uncharacterized protein TNCV_695961 [Trichonephila clavipes]